MLPLSLARPRTVAIATLAVSVVMGLGVSRLTTDVGYRAFLGPSHPVVRQLDDFLSRFGGGLPMAAVWSCEDSTACASVFDPAALGMAHDVARRMEAVGGVRRVDTPATSPLMARGFLEPLPRARRLAPEGTPVEDADELSRIALADPLWVGQLVSDDGTAGAVVVHLASTDGATSARVFDALRTALAPYEARGFRFSFAGGPVEFVVAGRELRDSTGRILPVMIGLVWLVLVGLFGSPVAVTASLATVGLAVLWTMGTMGWLGWPQNSLTQALAPLVLVIGVCDSIHVLARYVARLPGRDRGAAFLLATAEVGPPCLMTTLTTAAGFASFVVTPLESIRRFGLLAAVGVLAALLLTFGVLPALVVRLPEARVRLAPREERWRRVLGPMARFAERRRVAVLWGAALLGLSSLAGIARLRVDASFEDLYGNDSRVVRWAHEVRRVLRAPDTLEIAIEPPASDGETLPAALAVVDRLEGQLAGLDGLGRSRSLVDPMRRLNALLHPDPVVFDGATDAKGRPGSLLRLLRAEDAQVIDFLADRRSGALRISTEADKIPQDRLRVTLGRVRALVGADLPDGWRAAVTGPLAVVGEMIDELRTTQLRSFALAAVIVFLSVALFFRSWSDGALAMLPTVLPVLVTLGVMGLASVPLDVGSAMVAAVALGLAVDNAIHLLSAYRRQRRGGAPPPEAAIEAVLATGRPIATTSLALTAGFFTLLLSSWNSIAHFGAVCGVALGSAALAALLLLPAALAGTRR